MLALLDTILLGDPTGSGQTSPGLGDSEDDGVQAIPNTLATAFDGVNDTASVTPNAALSSGITNKLTVAVWIKAGAQMTTGIVSHWLATGNQQKWILTTGGGGDTDKMRIVLTTDGSTFDKDFVSSVVTLNSVYHLVGFSYDGTLPTVDQLKLYNDGAKDSSPTKTVDAATTSLFNNTADFVIGRTQVGNFYAGLVDEPMVFNTPFDDDDWLSLFNSGVPIQPTTHKKASSLVSHWQMGDGDTFNTILDQKGSNDLTMNSMAAEDFVADVP